VTRSPPRFRLIKELAWRAMWSMLMSEPIIAPMSPLPNKVFIRNMEK
jgi:hypothetical protein